MSWKDRIRLSRSSIQQPISSTNVERDKIEKEHQLLGSLKLLQIEQMEVSQKRYSAYLKSAAYHWGNDNRKTLQNNKSKILELYRSIRALNLTRAQFFEKIDDNLLSYGLANTC